MLKDRKPRAGDRHAANTVSRDCPPAASASNVEHATGPCWKPGGPEPMTDIQRTPSAVAAALARAVLLLQLVRGPALCRRGLCLFGPRPRRAAGDVEGHQPRVGDRQPVRAQEPAPAPLRRALLVVERPELARPPVPPEGVVPGPEHARPARVRRPGDGAALVLRVGPEGRASGGVADPVGVAVRQRPAVHEVVGPAVPQHLRRLGDAADVEPGGAVELPGQARPQQLHGGLPGELGRGAQAPPVDVRHPRPEEVPQRLDRRVEEVEAGAAPGGLLLGVLEHEGVDGPAHQDAPVLEGTEGAVGHRDAEAQAHGVVEEELPPQSVVDHVRGPGEGAPHAGARGAGG
eukprot:CAMPEP_0179294484 /NCGR_PEP_ID=MMETSP0797-20121207/43926_1 /TAXON_ID=47934 /ORGANISM="Dinophysis acuminata, Strain DAEP01" /LENGTH=345 /DNA_ID=CAMNT_0021003691 /DNA_START=78 /DNA_END=1111 /DNA_ORIENTATION=-